MPRTPVALEPVALALESLKLARGGDGLKAVGIDLESGQRMSVKLKRLAGHAAPADSPKLILVLSIERLSSVT